MQQTNHFKLGLFVTLSIAVMIIFLIMLGSLEHFQSKAPMMTLVSESVQGLSNGASVKFRGVPVGTVTDISIITQNQLIRIDWEVNLSKFHAAGDTGNSSRKRQSRITRAQFYDLILEKIEKQNLRCKLEAEGITGMKYIEFDYVKDAPQKSLLRPGLSDSNIFFFPSVPSLISDLKSSLLEIVDKLEKVDFPGMTESVEQSFRSVDKLLANPKLPQIIDNLDNASKGIVKIVDTVNVALPKDQIETLTQEARHAIKSFEDLSDFAQKEITKAKIQETTEEARNTLESFRQSSKRFNDTMNRLNDDLDAILELIQYLDSDPSALLYGKRANQALKE